MTSERSSTWRWSVCALLLLSTLLNYMDRQTLSQLSTLISRQFHLSNEQYGNLELVFGLSFVAGSIVIGVLADRWNVFWIYPAVLVGWSLAGIATASAPTIGATIDEWIIKFFGASIASSESAAADHGYFGLLLCRGALGFFEAGQWPCALVTTRRILSARDRTFGNGLLQSGGALGAILTPIVVTMMVNPDESESWRLPFLVIGGVGVLWLIPWLLLVRRSDLVLEREQALIEPSLLEGSTSSFSEDQQGSSLERATLIRRFIVLAILIVSVNMTWHFFRAWLPKFLQEFHHYSFDQVQRITFAYYLAADIGCIAVGMAVKRLAARGWQLQSARVFIFWSCCSLTALSVIAAGLGSGPLLLGLLFLIGFGSMGMFPLFYSFTQELSARNQGKVTGALAAIAWLFTSPMQKFVGRSVDTTNSYAAAIFSIGLLPLLGALAVSLGWGRPHQAPMTCEIKGSTL